MDFGKLESIDHVDFTLKKDPEFNLESFLLFDSNPEKAKTLYIGTTAWAHKNWVGSYYPLKAKPSEFLHYYSNQFNTIELNSSFYGIPEASTIIKWYNDSVEDFRFCPKVFQYISKSSNFGANGKDVDLFISSVEFLGDKLGPCFIQLPSVFDISYYNPLIEFLERVDGRIPLAIELRHPSWFSNDNTKFFSGFRDRNVSSVITDVAGRRDACHMYVTNPSILVRFVGNNLVPSDYVRINDWIERMQYWFEMGVENIYFFVHEPDTTVAPVLATYLGGEWNKVSNIHTRYPNIEGDNKKQLSLF